MAKKSEPDRQPSSTSTIALLVIASLAALVLFSRYGDQLDLPAEAEAPAVETSDGRGELIIVDQTPDGDQFILNAPAPAAHGDGVPCVGHGDPHWDLHEGDPQPHAHSFMGEC